MKEKNPGFLLALPSMIVLFLFFIVPLFEVVSDSVPDDTETIGNYGSG